MQRAGTSSRRTAAPRWRCERVLPVVLVAFAGHGCSVAEPRVRDSEPEHAEPEHEPPEEEDLPWVVRPYPPEAVAGATAERLHELRHLRVQRLVDWLDEVQRRRGRHATLRVALALCEELGLAAYEAWFGRSRELRRLLDRVQDRLDEPTDENRADVARLARRFRRTSKADVNRAAGWRGGGRPPPPGGRSEEGAGTDRGDPPTWIGEMGLGVRKVRRSIARLSAEVQQEGSLPHLLARLARRLVEANVHYGVHEELAERIRIQDRLLAAEGTTDATSVQPPTPESLALLAAFRTVAFTALRSVEDQVRRAHAVATRALESGPAVQHHFVHLSHGRFGTGFGAGYTLRPDTTPEAATRSLVWALSEGKPLRADLIGLDEHGILRGRDFWALVLADLTGRRFALYPGEGEDAKDRKIATLVTEVRAARGSLDDAARGSADGNR